MQIDLKLGGETIPLYFGMVAFEEMQGLVTSYLGSNKFATDVVWAGYLNQCAIESKYPTLAYRDFMVKLENIFFAEKNEESNLTTVLEAFEKSRAGAKLFAVIDEAVKLVDTVNSKIEEGKGEVKKKRVTKTLKK